MKSWFAACLFLLILVSCNGGSDLDRQFLVSQEVCTIQNGDCKMSFPVSIDIVNDESFVVSDGAFVYLYDMNGCFLREIGTSGNAKNEYNGPSAVKACGDSIYVWSSMSLSFLSYHMDGTPGAVYAYPSAVCDFVPTDSLFFVYTAGVLGDHVLDIVPKDGSATKSVHDASETHRILCSNASTVPIFYQDDKVFFSPKDSIEVYSYDLKSRRTNKISMIESSSFNVEPLPNMLKQMDRKSRSAYLRHNSMSILLFPDKRGNFNMMTLEGETVQTKDGVSNEDRYIAIYHFGQKGKVSYYNLESFGYWHLFSFNNGYIYFISHSISCEEDKYCLKRFSV